MGEILTNLNIDWKVILVNLIGFGLLWFAATKMVFAPIGKVITEREEDVNQTYAKLDADQAQMQSLKEDYERRLAAVEAEGRERINNMVKEAQAIRDQVINDANARSKEMVARAEQEIAREQELAFQNIRRQVVDLALGAATKVIGDGLDESRQRRLIDDFIAGGGTFDAALAGTSAAAAAPVAAPKPGNGGGVAGVVEAVKDAVGDAGAAIAAAVAGVAAGAAVALSNAGKDEDDAPATDSPAKPARARRTAKSAADTADAADEKKAE
jgi:F-type H+-transporting ATPase subunit b